MAESLSHAVNPLDKDIPPLLEGSGENAHSATSVEGEQNKGTQHFLSSTSHYITEDSCWNDHWSSTNVSEEEHSKGTDYLSNTTSFCKTEDPCWEGLKWSAPAALQVEQPSSPSYLRRTDTDSECSDVDLDNDWVTSGNSDSDASVESLETRKKNKWLCPFFTMLNDVLKTEYERESTLFYCPACRGSGLGETDLYKGLKPLMTHARNYMKRRVKLHKQFAAILEEDLKVCGNTLTTEACVGKSFNIQWHLTDDKFIDPLIVWPPMVLIRTTGVKMDMHQKRMRVETKRFLEAFKDYCPKRVRHAYDSAGNSALLSLVVFTDSPVGYMYAKHFVKNFKHSRKGRDQWNGHAALEAQSHCDEVKYAYMATEEDMMFFNTCDESKRKIAWNRRSYREAVIQPLVEMHEAKLENSLLKAQLNEQEEYNRFLEKCLSKLYKGMELTKEEAYVAQEIASRP